MKIPEHLTKHAFEYLIVAGIGAGWFGFEAYMDARHVMRTEAVAKERTEKILDYEQRMLDVDEEIERLELYNRFGGQVNKPARDQILVSQKAKRVRLSTALENYKDDTVN